MGKIFFTSDLHFGHYNVIRFDGRPFKDASEMDSEIIKRWNEVVTDNDTVYILGDISWHKDDKTVEIFSKLKGHKRLIRGNHDRLHNKVKDQFEWIDDYAELNINGTKVVLSHYPMLFYNGQHHGAYMFYGHVHNSREDVLVSQCSKAISDDGVPSKMFNVGCMCNDYTPKTFEQIIER